MDTKTTFYLADEQALFRDCVRFMLEKEENLYCAGEAADGFEAVSGVKRCLPDLVVMELSLPKLHGSSVIREIKRDSPGTRVIILSSSDAEENVLAAFQAGASAYCLKNSTVSELVQAVQQVAAGRTYLSPEIAGKVLLGYLDYSKRVKSGAC